MKQPDLDAYIQDILDGITTNATELARQRCSNFACQIAGAVLMPSEVGEREPGSNVVWLENLQHGIACELVADCHYAQHPEDTTAVFADAMEKTLAEKGLVGLIENESPGSNQSN